MKLGLLSATGITKIVELNGKVYHLSTAGVDVTDGSSWASLATLPGTFTSIAVNTHGLFVSAISGVYFIAAADVTAGGDLTAKAVLKYSAGTAVSISSNSVLDIDGKDTGLAVVTPAGIHYFPDTVLSTKYSFIQAGFTKCAISKTKACIAWARADAVFSGNIPTRDWNYGFMYKYGGVVDATIEYHDTWSPDYHYYVASTMYNGTMYTVGRQLTVGKFLTFWKIVDGVSTSLPIDTLPPSGPYYLKWAGRWLFCTYNTTLFIYEIVADSLVLRGSPAGFASNSMVTPNPTGDLIVSRSPSSTLKLTLWSFNQTTYEITELDTVDVSVNAYYHSWSESQPQYLLNEGGLQLIEVVGGNTLVNHGLTVEVPSPLAPYSSTWKGDACIVGFGVNSPWDAALYKLEGNSLVLKSSIESTNANVGNASGITLVGQQTVITYRDTLLHLRLDGDSLIRMYDSVDRGYDDNIGGNNMIGEGDGNYFPALHSVSPRAKTYTITENMQPLSFTQVNCLEAGENLFVGTENGIAILPLEPMFDQIVCYKDYEQVEVLSGVNVVCLSAGTGARLGKGQLAYGSTGANGKFSFIDLAKV